MLKYILSLVLLLSFPLSAIADTIYIRRDYGGEAGEYYQKAVRAAERGDILVIDGICASACLIYLHKDIGNTFCATERAQFGFHMPYYTDRRGRVTQGDNDYLRQVALTIVSGLPTPLSVAFSDIPLPDANKGANPEDMIWVTGSEAQRAVGACSFK